MFINKDEIDARSKGKFAHDIGDYEFLLRFNKNLEELESSLVMENVEEEYPNIFILGLPRSGTTLINQLIFNALDVGCTNNLMARFWDAPLCGTMLSKIILGKAKSNSYTSSYAASDNIMSPHQFAYFWRK